VYQEAVLFNMFYFLIGFYYSCLAWISSLLNDLTLLLFRADGVDDVDPVVVITDEDRIKQFYDTYFAKFSKLLQEGLVGEAECNGNHPNYNVEALFYDKAKLESISEEDYLRLIEMWKSRTMVVASPLKQHSNILMYYDFQKLAFAYHSDFAIHSPLLLNALAMKYVMMFRCLDFFVDEEMYDSPLKVLHSVEDEKKPSVDEKEDVSKKEFKEFLKTHSSAFLSKKPGSIATGSVGGKKPVLPIVIKNRFVYKSKVGLFPFLQSVKPLAVQKKREIQKELVFGIKPSLDCLFTDVMTKDIDSMFTDSTVPSASQELSYKAYKKRKHMDVCCSTG